MQIYELDEVERAVLEGKVSPDSPLAKSKGADTPNKPDRKFS
jgi:hypothetical protein